MRSVHRVRDGVCQGPMPSSTYLRLEEVEVLSVDGQRSTYRTTERSTMEQHGRSHRSSNAPWTDESLSHVDLSRTLAGERLLRRSAALYIQRWYRRQGLKYGVFGPMIFTCKDGRTADFGHMTFAVGNRSAQFLRVADTTSSSKLSHGNAPAVWNACPSNSNTSDCFKEVSYISIFANHVL